MRWKTSRAHVSTFLPLELATGPKLDRELRLRKEEVYLYDHLDDDWMRTELRNAINYTRRRIIRLREEADLTRIRSELAFLE